MLFSRLQANQRVHLLDGHICLFPVSTAAAKRNFSMVVASSSSTSLKRSSWALGDLRLVYHGSSKTPWSLFSPESLAQHTPSAPVWIMLTTRTDFLVQHAAIIAPLYVAFVPVFIIARRRRFVRDVVVVVRLVTTRYFQVKGQPVPKDVRSVTLGSIFPIWNGFMPAAHLPQRYPL